jgi:hypothetical protein
MSTFLDSPLRPCLQVLQACRLPGHTWHPNCHPSNICGSSLHSALNQKCARAVDCCSIGICLDDPMLPPVRHRGSCPACSRSTRLKTDSVFRSVSAADCGTAGLQPRVLGAKTKNKRATVVRASVLGAVSFRTCDWCYRATTRGQRPIRSLTSLSGPALYPFRPQLGLLLW